MRPSLLNLRFTAGIGVGISGACGPPLVWRARKPLPSALRSSAALALDLTRQRASVPEHRLPVMGLCLRPPWIQHSFLFSRSLLFLLVRVALKLRSLEFHSLRLCRIAVFLIQTNVSLCPPSPRRLRGLLLASTPPTRTLRTPTPGTNGSSGPWSFPCSVATCYCACSPEVTVTSPHPPRAPRLCPFSFLVFVLG